jgi:hypothetical protein
MIILTNYKTARQKLQKTNPKSQIAAGGAEKFRCSAPRRRFFSAIPFAVLITKSVGLKFTVSHLAAFPFIFGLFHVV